MSSITLRCFFLVFFYMVSLQAHSKSPQMQNFLVITDVHLNQNLLHTMNWTPRSFLILNDLDKKSFEDLMDSIVEEIKKERIPKPKFVLYLGDMTGHIRIGKQFIWENELAFFNKFTQAFPDIPILYTFGNNDSFVSNYGPFLSADKNTELKTPLDVAVSTGKWHNGFISRGEALCDVRSHQFPCMLSQNQMDGYYAAYIEPKLRFIDLNTVALSKGLFSQIPPDAEAQLNWLEQQLQAAKTNRESVMIAMHIPIGKALYNDQAFLMPAANQRLIELFQRYHSIIMGVLAAHTHMDEMKLLQDKEGNNLVGVYLTPALSTSHGNAPAIRSYAYTFLKDQWQLVDYTTFYFDLDSLNPYLLQKLYNYNEVYCHSKQQIMKNCLSQVSMSSIEKYYTAGNNKTRIHPNYPKNIYIHP